MNDNPIFTFPTLWGEGETLDDQYWLVFTVSSSLTVFCRAALFPSLDDQANTLPI